MKPSVSASSAGTQPMPFGEVMTGTPSRCDSAVSSGPASESVAPWPMKSTGRCDCRNRLITAAISALDAAGRCMPEVVRLRRHRYIGLFLVQVVRNVEVHRTRAGP